MYKTVTIAFKITELSKSSPLLLYSIKRFTKEKNKVSFDNRVDGDGEKIKSPQL